MNVFNLTDHLSKQPPCPVELDREIDAKEQEMVASEKVLRLCMALTSPAKQAALIKGVWPLIQDMETSLLALRDVRDAEIGKTRRVAA